MKKKSIFLVIIFYLLLLPWACSKRPAPGSPESDLSPIAWPRGELEKYSQLNLVTGVPKPPVEAKNGMVVGACGPLAIRAGVEALKKGSPGDEEFLKDIERIIKKKSEAREASGHSDCVVAIDKEGNMAAIVHSINSQYFWFCITVDGVSVADTGSYMQEIIALLGPGKRLIDSTNQVIVLKQGRPFLATSCIGGGLYEVTLQCVVNVLDYNMDPQTAVEKPYFMTPAMHPAENSKQTVGEGQFPDEILEALQAMGQEIKVLSSEEQWLQTGGWVGIKIDPQTGKCKGGVPLWLNGVAAGY